MRVEEFLSRVKGVRRSGNGWIALCPAHSDRDPSLSVHVRDGTTLLHCHAGCTTEAVCAALGIKIRDLFPDGGSPPQIAETYGYTDEHGNLLFEVVRLEPKSFRQRRPDGKGGWIWSLNGTRRVLYRLPEVLSAESVLVLEGEKDVESARSLGLVATCNPGGAGKWREEYSESLRGKRIAIIADADEAGRKHAQQVATSLYGKVESLKVVELPGTSKDLSEWLAAGGTRRSLEGFIEEFVPEWTPANKQEPTSAVRRQRGDAERFLRENSEACEEIDAASQAEAEGGPGSHSRTAPKWPEPLAEQAFHGVAGEIVRAIDPTRKPTPQRSSFNSSGSLETPSVAVRTSASREHSTSETCSRFLLASPQRAVKGLPSRRLSACSRGPRLIGSEPGYIEAGFHPVKA